MKKIDATKFAEFIARPRTVAEISAEFKADGLDEAAVRALIMPAGQSLFEQKDEDGRSIFMAAPVEQPKTVKPRIWACRVDPRREPYIWIQFPPDFKLPRLKVAGLSDVHYGAKAHNGKRFREYLKWIGANDDVYTFLNGDIIENAILDAVGGAAYESVLTPDEQIFGSPEKGEPGMIELLRPIAHKIWWAQPGNHEWRTWKKCNLDPLKVICTVLGIPYFSEPIFADVLAWGQRYTFYCHHGVSGSNTKGGKLNAAMRPAEFQEAVDFIIMGHVHDSMGNPVGRFERKRIYDDKGKLVDLQLEQHVQHVTICPSFHGYFESYGSRAGYAPGSWGTVVCTLNHDGSRRLSE